MKKTAPESRILNNRLRVLSILFAAAWIFIFLLPSVLSAITLSDQKNYTYLYYQNGYPTQGCGTRAPQSDANQAGRDNPDLVFQTGYYSMRFDTDDLKITGWNALAGTNYLSALNTEATVFSAGTLNLYYWVDETTRYTAMKCDIQNTEEWVQDDPDGNFRHGSNFVRLIEGGQYRQRIDHINVRFKDSGDKEIPGAGGVLEITAWPDRVTFTLDCTNISDAIRTTVQFIDPAGKQYLRDLRSKKCTLAVSPVGAPVLTDANALSYITEAKDLKHNNQPLTGISFDTDTNSVKIVIPTDEDDPADKDRLDEYKVVVKNPTSVEVNLPLVFEEQSERNTWKAITGTTMVLCADNNDYGYPLGQNVQISKDYHADYTLPGTWNPKNRYDEYAGKHAGYWLRGITMVRLGPNETKTYRLRIVKGYWAGIPAAHNAQLCLIGYGDTGTVNWTWEQSALGAWGEALTYDLSGSTSNTHLNDMRPAFTTPTDTDYATHNWTENVGGGNFLIYRDNLGKFQHLKRLKTAYLRNGPNLAEVRYAGYTGDEKIKATFTTQLGRTYDYHRVFHTFRYQFLQNVTPKRLIFYQIAGDYYKTAKYTTYHYGTTSGRTATKTDSTPYNGYNGYFSLATNGWLAIEDIQGDNGGNDAMAVRGFILRSLKKNGVNVSAKLCRYRSGGDNNQTLFDLTVAGSYPTSSYKAGDVIEGVVELVFPPKNYVRNYWGEDFEFSNRLSKYSNHWSAVYDEARYNNYNVTVNKGTLINKYPLEVQAASTTDVIDVTIQSGGIGHIPVIVRKVPKGYFLRAQRLNGSTWVWLEGVNLTTDQNYYQGTVNENGTMDYAFNINRPELNLANAWRFRILKYTP